MINTISIGWVLARIGPGAHITMKQVKVDGEHWMPKEIDVNGSAKILLVKNRTLDETVSYSDYKRVRAPRDCDREEPVTAAEDSPLKSPRHRGSSFRRSALTASNPITVTPVRRC